MLPPPGVPMTDEGRAACCEGGVEGGGSLEVLASRLAGEGELARKRRRSAPSSPRIGLPPFWLRVVLVRFGGGVRGGEEPIIDEVNWKECIGRSLSSSSEGGSEVGE